MSFFLVKQASLWSNDISKPNVYVEMEKPDGRTGSGEFVILINDGAYMLSTRSINDLQNTQ